MPSKLAWQTRDVVLDVKESMCTRSSTRQCEAHRERSKIAQWNDFVCTGCVGLTVGHRLSVSVPLRTCRSKCVRSVSERGTMHWEYSTKCVCVLIQYICVFGPMRLCLCVAHVVLLESMVTSAGVSKWQGLFVGVVICFEKSGTDSWWRQQEGATTSPPHHHHNHIKCHLFPG